MRLHAIGLVTALAAVPALGQAPLVCPPAATPSAHACDAFHYHVQLYRPDTRSFVELVGINQFATQSACDRARETAMKRNLAVIDFYRRQRNDQRYEPDRFGPCHCDMTTERTSANFLGDMQRVAQVRLAAEVRMRVRERLLDADVPSDSELLRGLTTASPVGGPKLVPLPAAPAMATVSNAPADLKITKMVDAAAPSMLDLPLADPIAPPPVVAAATLPASAPTQTPAPVPAPTPASPPTPAPTPAPPAPAPPQPPPPPAATPAPAPASTELPVTDLSVPDAADAFIPTEMERVQKIIAASSALADDSVRVKVLEVCSQRIQLLSNLRSLIEGSGQRSPLANAAREAHDEAQRLAVVAKLFGADMPSHWAPKDARDAIVQLPAEPEKILRAASSSAEEKRHALYAFLATGSPTDEQQLGVNRVVEALLR